MRSLVELTSSRDPAWPAVAEWIRASPHTVEVLPVAERDRERCLSRLQVTTGSTLGALAWHTGGILVDHGWLRLLGGGSADLADLATASGLEDTAPTATPPPDLVVGYDVLGGRFAINGGDLPGPVGQVAYFAPDTLEWMALELGHNHFVQWCLTGDTGAFYASLRWAGWEGETSTLGPHQGISFYPPLFTREGQADLASCSRAPVPWQELDDLQKHVSAELRHVLDGDSISFEVTDEQVTRPAGRWRRTPRR